MKRNKCEKTAWDWLVKSGLAKPDEKIAIFPDIYIPSTKEFYEVKLLVFDKYRRNPRISLSTDQYSNFKKLNPTVLVFHPETPDVPFWKGRFQTMLDTPEEQRHFIIYIYEQKYDRIIRKEQEAMALRK